MTGGFSVSSSVVPPFLKRLDRQEQEKDDDADKIHDAGHVEHAVYENIKSLKQREGRHDFRQQTFKLCIVHIGSDHHGKRMGMDQRIYEG